MLDPNLLSDLHSFATRFISRCSRIINGTLPRDLL
jgi:hypothetical protein